MDEIDFMLGADENPEIAAAAGPKDPANPAATPDVALKIFGGSDWTLSDWQTWFRAMQNAYGHETAVRRFVNQAQHYAGSYWYVLPPGFATNPAFVDWLAKNGLAESLQELGIIDNALATFGLDLNRLIIDIDGILKMLKWLIPTLVIGAIAIFAWPRVARSYAKAKRAAK